MANPFRPTGISIKIREDLVEGSSRSQTTLIVDPIITPDGHRVVMSDIGDICYATLDQGTSNEEIISFTGITDNTTTYTLTGCVWGYNFYNNNSGISANMKRHVSGGSFIITNPDHFLSQQYVSIDSNQTIAGEKTFSSTPKSNGGDPLVGTDLVIKSYVDALVLGTLTTINVIVPGKAGETVAAGQLMYFDLTDNEWKLTDATDAATVNNVLLGIAQGAGTDGNAITDGVLLQGVDDNQSGLTEGDVYYASDTAGAIANSAGTVEVTVGLGKSATELYFNPRFNQQITEDQQDALAGTAGTPSATNKYVTNDDTATAATANKVARRLAGGNITVVTESAGDNSTKAASTAYVDAALITGVIAGDTLRLSADTERIQTTDRAVYTKVKEIRAYPVGTYRVKFDLKSVDNTSTAYGRIYKNGVAVGTERTQTSSTYGTYSEDILFVPGDLIQIYAKSSSGLVGDEAAIRNFRLYYTASSAAGIVITD